MYVHTSAVCMRQQGARSRPEGDVDNSKTTFTSSINTWHCCAAIEAHISDSEDASSTKHTYDLPDVYSQVVLPPVVAASSKTGHRTLLMEVATLQDLRYLPGARLQQRSRSNTYSQSPRAYPGRVHLIDCRFRKCVDVRVQRQDGDKQFPTDVVSRRLRAVTVLRELSASQPAPIYARENIPAPCAVDTTCLQPPLRTPANIPVY